MGPSKPLVLHMGSTVQFTSKDPNPEGLRLSHEAPHLGEEKHAMIMRTTVSQFPKDDPNPDARMIDGSHLGEEENRPMLRQGGVCQFPKEYKAPRDVVRGYQPPEEVKDTLPVADVEHPDHLLPSQARKQQTYITHPSQQTVKPVYGVDSGPRNRNVTEWPPKRSGVRELPRVGFNSGHIHPEGEFSQVEILSFSCFTKSFFSFQGRNTLCGHLQSLDMKRITKICHPLARDRRPTRGIPRLTEKLFHRTGQ